MNQEIKLPKLAPDIRLFGGVGDEMLAEFFRQQDEAPPDGPILMELSSNGGNADMGRRLAQELRLWQEKAGRDVWFLGKTYVYSAAVTVMSAIPRERRFMTGDCEVLIHERKMTRELRIDGALRGCRAVVLDLLAEIESGERLQRAGFEQLAKGTGLTADDIEKRVMEKDWYLTAAQALDAGLIAGVV
ncbi:ATP-dependent Clp protease proteolytic subunit [Ramlibacter sp.]|uniref:ATP-dependent Clp protease proteolytic subunit n=1 Tax=Ramlibacter sp. TaxID=1917967 RepID=UPI003D0D7175